MPAFKGQSCPKLLSALLTDACLLNDYFFNVLPHDLFASLTTARFSSPGLAALLSSTFISCPTALPTGTRWKYSQNTTYIKEIVHLAIAMHLETARLMAKRANTLCLGYRTLREGACGTLAQCPVIENHFPNPLICHFLTIHWERLLELVGEDVILHILLEAIIIVEQRPGYFLQIAGIPVSEMHRPSKVCQNERKIRRHSMLYASASSAILSQGLGGLPFHHALNKCKNAHRQIALTKAIFYSAGLSEPGSRNKTWLKAVRFTRTLLSRHKKCPYERLFEYYCKDLYSAIIPESHMIKFADLKTWACNIQNHQICSFIKAVLRRLLAPRKREAELAVISAICKSI